MIIVRYKDTIIECGTAAEAAAVTKELHAQDGAAPLSVLSVLRAMALGPWKNKLFWEFIGSLGEPQKQILALLAKNKRMTAGDLCKAMGVKDNNQLSGLLSGISKQAAAHDVSARSVYTIENETRAGEMRKTYGVTPEFLRIAEVNNWPDD